MRNLIALIPIVSLVCGCSAGEQISYQVYIDDNISASQKQIVVDSILGWEEATSGQVVFYKATDWRTQDYLITITPSTIPELTTLEHDADDNEHIHGGIYGLTHYMDNQSSLISVAVEVRDPIMFRHIVEHELGHALGLEHTERDTLMYWSVRGGANTIVCADVAQFCSIHGCNEYQMNGCKL